MFFGVGESRRIARQHVSDPNDAIALVTLVLNFTVRINIAAPADRIIQIHIEVFSQTDPSDTLPSMWPLVVQPDALRSKPSGTVT